MPPPAMQPTALARARAGLAVLFAALCAAYLAWGWSSDLTELGGDSAYYMMAARQLSPFTPAVPAYAQALRESIYPPLFPLAVGLLGGSFLAAHLLVVAALLAALACLYRWLRDAGCGMAAAAWTCAVFALMPGTYLQALNIWTENPYLFLSLAAIAAAGRATASGRLTHWWIAAAAVAAATLVRAAAIPLLAAFALQLVIARPRRWYGLLAAAALPFCLWALWSLLHRAGLTGYAAQWSQSYGAGPASALQRQAAREAPALLRSWLQDWLGDGRMPALVWLAWLSGAAGLLGCAWRLRRLHFDAIYAALYLTLILVWPFPAEAQRLGYVIVPVLLAQAVLAVQALAARRRPGAAPYSTAAVLGAWSLLLVPSLLLSLGRFLQAPPDLAGARHFAGWYADDRAQALRLSRSQAWIFADLRRIADVVPLDDCIVAIKPSVVTLYTQRLSRTPPPPSAGADEFRHGMDSCRYAYLLAYISPSFPQAMYPEARLDGGWQALSMLRDPSESPPAIYAVLLRRLDPAPPR